LGEESTLNLNKRPLGEGKKILTEFLTEKRLNPVYCYEDLHLDNTRKKKYKWRQKI